ncbi:MAG: hemolysin-type calcium-binding repeat family protein [Rhizobium sp.]|nr:hemolysin-type calcium-binding repeat family protein [Rhizobium sp.]
MTTHTQKNDLTGTWNIDTSDDTWVLAGNASITTNGTEAIDLGAEFTGNTIKLNGDVHVSGLVGQAIRIDAEDTTLDIGKNSVVDAPFTNVGILVAGHAAEIHNDGKINASLSGIVGGGYTRVYNSGTITADNAVASGESSFQVFNSGKLLGDVYGVNTVADNSGVINSVGGIIKGGDTAINSTGEGTFIVINQGLIKGPTAIADGEGDAVISNRKGGTIDGDVILGAGEDTFQIIGGTMKGTVFGGEDNDTYILYTKSGAIEELADQGMDQVYAKFSYTLGENLENLTLIGNKDLKATGNEGNNSLYGNKGDNVLRGMDGEDYLGSGRGNDLMIGGADSDIFEFNTKNGHDTIKDFQDGSDVIFSNFISESDVQDILDNHATETQGGVLIEYGKNSMFIKGMDLDHLGADDFFWL